MFDVEQHRVVCGRAEGSLLCCGVPSGGDLGSSDRGSQAKATCDAQGLFSGHKNEDVATQILYG